MATTAKQQEYKCKCGTDLKRIQSKKNQKFYWVCQAPEEVCNNIYSDADGRPLIIDRGEPQDDVRCPDCSSPMRLIQGGKYGDYWSCSAYPQCKGTLDVNPSGGPCPECPEDPDHGPMRLRTGKNGQFWSCRKYPGCSATLELDGKPGKKPKKKE